MEKDLHGGRRWDPRKGKQGQDKTGKTIAAKKVVSDASNLLNKAYNEEVAMGTGPVNVAANVADPKNKRLFGQPIKRFKNFKAK